MSLSNTSGKGPTYDQNDHRLNGAGVGHNSVSNDDSACINRTKGQRETSQNTTTSDEKDREAFEEGYAFQLLEEARQKQNLNSAMPQKLSEDAENCKAPINDSKKMQSDDDSDSGESLFNEIDAIFETHRAAKDIDNSPNYGTESTQSSRFLGGNDETMGSMKEDDIMPWKTSTSITGSPDAKSATTDNRESHSTSWSIEGTENIQPHVPKKQEKAKEPAKTKEPTRAKEPGKSKEPVKPKDTAKTKEPAKPKAKEESKQNEETKKQKAKQVKDKTANDSPTTSGGASEAKSTPKLTPRSNTIHPSPLPPAQGKGLLPPNYDVATSVTPPPGKTPGEVASVTRSSTGLTVPSPTGSSNSSRPIAIANSPFPAPQSADMSAGRASPAVQLAQQQALYAQVAHQQQLFAMQQQIAAQQRPDQMVQYDHRNLMMYQEYAQKLLAELSSLQKAPQSAHQVPEHQRALYMKQIEERFAVLQQEYAACQQRIREEVMKFQQFQQLQQQPAQQLQAHQRHHGHQFMQQQILPVGIPQQFAQMSPQQQQAQHQSFMLHQAQQQQQQAQHYMYLQQMAHQQRAQQQNMTPEHYAQLLRHQQQHMQQ
eukprot:Tbor_TRINITY_DN5617_c1_g2::TRINITY_DN5617_c1_g2_i2::g.8876::m.8876